jgi:hypothetical protein
LAERAGYLGRMTRNLMRLTEHGDIDSGLDLDSAAEVLAAVLERAAQVSTLRPDRDPDRLLTALESTWRRALATAARTRGEGR